MRSSRPALRPASKPAPRWWFVWSRDWSSRPASFVSCVWKTTSRKLISLAFTNEDEDMLGATAWVLTWQNHAQPVPSNESKPLCRLTLRKLYVFGFLQPTTFARAKSAFPLRPRRFRNITTSIVIASGYKSCGSHVVFKETSQHSKDLAPWDLHQPCPCPSFCSLFRRKGRIACNTTIDHCST